MTSIMKVLYVVNSTSLLGGASKSLLVLLNGLVQKDVCPIVVTPDEKGIYNVLKSRGIQVYALMYRPNTYPFLNSFRDLLMFVPRLLMRRILSNLAVNKVVKLCKKENVQIIHTNVSVIDVGFRASVKLHIPHIYHFREFCDIDFDEHYYPSKSNFYKSLKEFNSYSICITKTLQEYHGLQGPRSEVIYNGIEVNENSPHDNRDKCKFLYAGRIEPAKGLMQLINAYNLYKNKVRKPYTLLVAGDVCDRKYYKSVLKCIKDYGLDDYIIFLGGRKDIKNIMQEVSAVIVCSRFEAFGRCMPEAMGNRCLVIGKNTGGTKEQFDNGLSLTGHEIGLRYDTVEDLMARLVEVSSASANAYEEMKQAAFETVVNLYSVKQNIENVFSFYKKILCDN